MAKYFFISGLILCFSRVFGQTSTFEDAYNQLKIHNISGINHQQFDGLEALYIKSNINIINKGIVDSIAYYQANSISKTSARDSIFYQLIKGDHYLYDNISKDSLAFESYAQAVKLSQRIKDTLLIVESCKKIFKKLYKSQHNLEIYPYYLNIFSNYLYDNNEKATYYFHLYNYLGSEQRIEKIDALKVSLKLAEKSNNYFLMGKTAQLIGVEYNFFRNNKDSALVYYQKSKYYLDKKPFLSYNIEKFGVLGNIGLIYQNNKQFSLAKSYFLQADAINLPKYRYIEKVKLNTLLSENYKSINNWDSAYYYLNRANTYSDTLNEYQKAIQISDINTKYKTAEKEKKILEQQNELILEKQRKRQNRNIAIGLGGSLALTTIIGFLYFNNKKKKQEIALQNQIITQEKLKTQLKDQELKAVDAMIEGQEKERQNIANELHDELGSLMATIKMHFSSLKIDSSDEVYNKTNFLLENAYQKVRHISHAKNAGVLAKKGLFKAVEDLAKSNSISNKIDIKVYSNANNERLSNSLELTVFRITQELITNVIKHANANQVEIYINLHENNLNLLVEDNGIGFTNSSKHKSSSGIGLNSIEKRVEALGGTFVIESQPQKGTSVIIDMPL